MFARMTKTLRNDDLSVPIKFCDRQKTYIHIHAVEIIRIFESFFHAKYLYTLASYAKEIIVFV